VVRHWDLQESFAVAFTGLAGSIRRCPSQDVSLLGAIIASVMTLGSSGQIPVFRNAARIVSGFMVRSFALVMITLDSPEVLQDTKNDYVETLQNMGGMCGIADHENLMCPSVFKEATGIISSVFVEVLDPLHSDLTICPSFL